MKVVDAPRPCVGTGETPSIPGAGPDRARGATATREMCAMCADRCDLCIFFHVDFFGFFRFLFMGFCARLRCLRSSRIGKFLI